MACGKWEVVSNERVEVAYGKWEVEECACKLEKDVYRVEEHHGDGDGGDGVHHHDNEVKEHHDHGGGHGHDGVALHVLVVVQIDKQVEEQIWERGCRHW